MILLGGLDDALEVFRPFGPGERRRILAVFLEIANQEILQVFLGTLNALGKCLPGEKAEEALDHVHPRGVRRSVVKMYAWVTQEPLFGRFVFVNVEIVEDDVKFANGIGSHDVVHET